MDINAIALNAAISGSNFAEPDACLVTKMALSFGSARLPRFSISSCHCAMDGKFRIVAAHDAKQLIDHDFYLRPLTDTRPRARATMRSDTGSYTFSEMQIEVPNCLFSPSMREATFTPSPITV